MLLEPGLQIMHLVRKSEVLPCQCAITAMIPMQAMQHNKINALLIIWHRSDCGIISACVAYALVTSSIALASSLLVPSDMLAPSVRAAVRARCRTFTLQPPPSLRTAGSLPLVLPTNEAKIAA